MGDPLDDRLGNVLKNLRDDLSDAERAASDKLSARVASKRRATFAAMYRDTVERHRAILAEENPDALWPDGFDDAFIGLARRCGQPLLAAFSMKAALAVLMDRGMTAEEASEYFAFNVVGAWMGPGTPIWVDDTEEE